MSTNRQLNTAKHFGYLTADQVLVKDEQILNMSTLM